MTVYDQLYQPPVVQIGLWTPALLGATNNPVPTYTTQFGYYYLIGEMLFFTGNIVTSTMTKTTLTDEIRISLPFTSFDQTSELYRHQLMLKNSTPVKDGNVGRITPNTSYLTVYQNSLTGGDAALTYGLLDLGVLTNTITIEFSGFYRLHS